MQIEALKEAYEAKRNVVAKRISFTSDHVDETTPHLRVILLPLTSENLSAKDVIKHKKDAQDRRNFLKQYKKRVPRAKFARWSRRKHNLTA